MRSLLGSFTVVVLCSIVAPAAPVPTHLMKEDPLYYPTTVDTRWVYEDSSGEETLTITKVETIDGAQVVTVERGSERGGGIWEKMSVSAKGLVRIEGVAGALEPKLVMLKAPFKVREMWDIKTSGLEGTNTIEAIGEEVTVPAGKFNAVRVNSDYTLGNQRMNTVFWYAPGVGLVKYIHDKNMTRVLKSFTPGR